MSHVGNSKSVFTTLGARNYAKSEREINDFYATEPRAVELLLEQENFSHKIWEPACGMGHISEVLKQNGYEVLSTDLIDRGYGEARSLDFLNIKKETIDELNTFHNQDIVTNPPYKYALEFVLKALELVDEGNKVAMFLKLQFLEGKKRRELLFDKYPPKIIYVSSARLNCAKNGDFDSYGSSAIAYAWFVWEKSYKGDTIIKWIN